MAHPLKGIPRDQWPAAMAAKQAQAAAAGQVSPVIPPPLTAAGGKGAPAVGTSPISPPRNLFSGDIKKLEVFGRNGSSTDPIPDYSLYWFLDRDNSGIRLHQAKVSGYEFVTTDEVALNDNSAGNSDLGSQVRVFGGTFQNAPVYHYLMKKPKWLHETHQREMQQVPDRIEYELKRGTYAQQPGDGRYTAGPGSSLPPIDISSTVSRSK